MGRKKVIGGQGFQLACTLAPRLCAFIGAGTRGQFPPVGCVRFPGDGRRKEEAWAGTYARQGKPPPSCATRFAAPHSLHNLHYLCTIHLDRHIMQGVFSTVHARLAQLDRALASGAKGRKFDSCIARHKNQGLMINSWVLFLCPKYFSSRLFFFFIPGDVPLHVYVENAQCFSTAQLLRLLLGWRSADLAPLVHRRHACPERLMDLVDYCFDNEVHYRYMRYRYLRFVLGGETVFFECSTRQGAGTFCFPKVHRAPALFFLHGARCFASASLSYITL